MDHNLFHTALEWGGMPMHLHLLSSFSTSEVSVDEAIDEVAPFLQDGLDALEEF